MKITQINKETMKGFRILLAEVIKPLDTTLGIQLKVGNCTYSRTGFTFKLEGAIRGDDGKFDTKERTDFRNGAWSFGLNATDLDSKFENLNEIYTIYGLKPRSPKYPILGQRVRDGKIFKFNAETIRRGLM